METLSGIVKGYRDRIQRGGGSVVVSSAGGVTITPVTGQSLVVNNTLNMNGNGIAGVASIVAAGPITVGASTAGNVALNVQSAAASNAQMFFLSAAAVRGRIRRPANSDDLIVEAATGAAGSEVYTEALRIVNANGYVSVATRLGVGTASPSCPLHVAGQGWFTSNQTTGTIHVEAQGASGIAGFFAQTAANATAPVLVVKGGATPSTGGDLAQFQGSTGTTLASVQADGRVYSRAGFEWLNTTSQTTVGAAGGAATLPATPVGYLPVYVAGVKYVVPYYNAA